MDSLGHSVAAVGSIGPFSVHFSDVSVAAGGDAALKWNEGVAEMARAHPRRFWATAAVPLTDTRRRSTC
jgi:aminocarboxymuconate-semialdehyde decarboxylase